MKNIICFIFDKLSDIFYCLWELTGKRKHKLYGIVYEANTFFWIHVYFIKLYIKYLDK